MASEDTRERAAETLFARRPIHASGGFALRGWLDAPEGEKRAYREDVDAVLAVVSPSPVDAGECGYRHFHANAQEVVVCTREIDHPGVHEGFTGTPDRPRDCEWRWWGPENDEAAAPPVGIDEGLREMIARVLAAHDGWGWHDDDYVSPDPSWRPTDKADYREGAEKVLAALPSSAAPGVTEAARELLEAVERVRRRTDDPLLAQRYHNAKRRLEAALAASPTPTDDPCACRKAGESTEDCPWKCPAPAPTEGPDDA